MWSKVDVDRDRAAEGTNDEERGEDAVGVHDGGLVPELAVSTDGGGAVSGALSRVIEVAQIYVALCLPQLLPTVSHEYVPLLSLFVRTHPVGASNSEVEAEKRRCCHPVEECRGLEM